MKGRTLFGPGTFVLGGGAIVLIGLLLIGFLLPAEWSASVERTVDAAPTDVLALIDAPEGWRTWTTWPDSTRRSGPERGAGATMSWEDRELGRGRFRIEEASGTEVRYSVSVEGVGSSLSTRGSITLSAAGGTTRLRWQEEGDLGNNPLMGWWGLTMERAQSRELEKSLDQLEAVLSGEDPFATTDSVPSR